MHDTITKFVCFNIPNCNYRRLISRCAIETIMWYIEIHFVHREYNIKQAEFPKPPKPLLYMPTHYSGFIQVCPTYDSKYDSVMFVCYYCLQADLYKP